MNNDPTPPSPLAVTPETINAVIEALGGLTMAITRALPADRQEAFAVDLARIGRQLGQARSAAGETLMNDLHRAARIASSDAN